MPNSKRSRTVGKAVARKPRGPAAAKIGHGKKAPVKASPKPAKRSSRKPSLKGAGPVVKKAAAKPSKKAAARPSGKVSVKPKPATGRASAPAKKAVAVSHAKGVRKPVRPLPAAAREPEVRKTFTAREKRVIRERLVALSLELSAQVRALKQDSLTREDSVNSEEDGTDAFDRQFALSIVSSEQQSLAEIQEAIHRLEDGTYGQCECCGGLIEIPRLEALPFVQTCITCQADIEKHSGQVHRVSPARRSL